MGAHVMLYFASRASVASRVEKSYVPGSFSILAQFTAGAQARLTKETPVRFAFAIDTPDQLQKG